MKYIFFICLVIIITSCSEDNITEPELFPELPLGTIQFLVDSTEWKSSKAVFNRVADFTTVIGQTDATFFGNLSVLLQGELIDNRKYDAILELTDFIIQNEQTTLITWISAENTCKVTINHADENEISGKFESLVFNNFGDTSKISNGFFRVPQMK